MVFVKSREGRNVEGSKQLQRNIVGCHEVCHVDQSAPSVSPRRRRAPLSEAEECSGVEAQSWR